MSQIFNFRFELWATLASHDPEAFERQRARVIQNAIGRANPELRHRLRGLQFRIDMERERAGTPLASCIRLSEIMWDNFYGEFMTAVCQAKDASASSPSSPEPVSPPTAAKVIPFRPRRDSQDHN